ncbi:hypothetical protein ACW5F0_04615 [Luteimonas sp. A534]
MPSLRSIAVPSAVALTIALATASCATPPEAPSAAPGNVSVEGTVASIDTQPWTYDGSAVVEVDVVGRGRVAVRLPARWNLCEAEPVDVQALAVGMRVLVAGASGDGDGLTVCSDAAHRLVPLDDGSDPTRGGDGSAIALMPLSAAEIDAAALAGELACSFSSGEAGEAPLLLARGDVASAESARGVVKVGDYIEPVAAPGGFDAMLRGTRFSGAGKTIDITLTGAASGGGESPVRPATLVYHRADGAQRRWSGWWQCGP